MFEFVKIIVTPPLSVYEFFVLYFYISILYLTFSIIRRTADCRRH